MEIVVDEDVRKMIMEEKQDYRVCTACLGPALVPTSIKPAKPTDLRIQIGENALFISRIQAMYVARITMEMVYEEDEVDSCPAFYYR